MESIEDDMYWRYQENLLVAAREHDPVAAGSASASSLLDARDRIKALLAAQNGT